MRIEACRDSAKWDAYVASMPTASNYHRWNWKHVIEDTFNHEAFYLAAFEGDAIQGILPLFRMKSRLFGHFLVSIPFFSCGGILAGDSTTTDALLDYAGKLAGELGVSHIELRQGASVSTSWQDTTAKVIMEVELPQLSVAVTVITGSQVVPPVTVALVVTAPPQPSVAVVCARTSAMASALFV